MICALRRAALRGSFDDLVVYADWLEERQLAWTLCPDPEAFELDAGYGNGYSKGDGYGYGNGYSNGSGYSYGYGNGYGGGTGFGCTSSNTRGAQLSA